jgi:hypothetical protein
MAIDLIINVFASVILANIDRLERRGLYIVAFQMQFELLHIEFLFSFDGCKLQQKVPGLSCITRLVTTNDFPPKWKKKEMQKFQFLIAVRRRYEIRTHVRTRKRTCESLLWGLRRGVQSIVEMGRRQPPKIHSDDKS